MGTQGWTLKRKVQKDIDLTNGKKIPPCITLLLMSISIDSVLVKETQSTRQYLIQLVTWTRVAQLQDHFTTELLVLTNIRHLVLNTRAKIPQKKTFRVIFFYSPFTWWCDTCVVAMKAVPSDRD